MEMSEILNTEKLRQQIRELDAVRNYEDAKAQRDKALAQVSELQARMLDYEKIEREKDNATNSLVDLNKHSIKLLQEVFEQLDRPKDLRVFDNEVAESGLPGIIEEAVERLLAKRLAEANAPQYRLIFKAEVQKQIDALKKSQSILWTDADDQEVKKLSLKQLEDPFVALMGSWKKRCFQCNQDHILSLRTTADIKEILVKQHVDISPNIFLSSKSAHHTLRFTLADVVKMYLEKK